MNIKEASRLTGISKDMLRHYEKLGILSPGRNSLNRYRDYSETDINNAVMVRQYSSLGIPLKTIAEMAQKGDAGNASTEFLQSVRRLESDLSWMKVRLENARDYAYLFSLIEKGEVSDTGICPKTYYYRRPEGWEGSSWTDPCINGAVRLVFYIPPERTGLSAFPTDQGILSIKPIENYPLPCIEIPQHRYWRTVIEQAPDELLDGARLAPILQKLQAAGHALRGGILISQVMSASEKHPRKLVCVECDVGA